MTMPVSFHLSRAVTVTTALSSGRRRIALAVLQGDGRLGLIRREGRGGGGVDDDRGVGVRRDGGPSAGERDRLSVQHHPDGDLDRLGEGLGVIYVDGDDASGRRLA